MRRASDRRLQCRQRPPAQSARRLNAVEAWLDEQDCATVDQEGDQEQLHNLQWLVTLPKMQDPTRSQSKRGLA